MISVLKSILILFSHKASKAQRVIKPNKSFVSWCGVSKFAILNYSFFGTRNVPIGHVFIYHEAHEGHEE